MKKITILVMILFILIAVTISLIYIINPAITGGVIQEYNYSYTKAICDEDNFCQDYEIICNNETLVEMNPITGAAVQQPDNWQDPRDKETIERLCE